MAALVASFHLYCTISRPNSRISLNTWSPRFPTVIVKPSTSLRASSSSDNGDTSPPAKPTARRARKKSPTPSSPDAPVKRTRRSTKIPPDQAAQNEASNDVATLAELEQQDKVEESGKKKSKTATRARRSTKLPAEETSQTEFSDSEIAKQDEVEEYGRKKSSGGKRTRRSTKILAEYSESEEPEIVTEVVDDGEDENVEGIGDEIEVSYESTPLVCCFGAAQREFVPTVRVSDRQMHPDQYSTWKQLQWSPPEFVRAPGGPPSNVAISHVRLGGRAVFMGKVGDDEFGNSLVDSLKSENVQTRAVKVDSNAKTATSFMKIQFRDSEDGTGGKLVAETRRKCAEDSFLRSEIDVSVLKEAKIFHFNSEVLLTPAMHSPLFRAIALSKKFGSNVFFDLNLPLPLWRSRDNTREVIKKAWSSADLIEVSRQELEFLLDEKYYENMRNYRPQYYSESYEQTRNRRNTHHYTREEIAPLWHNGIKILFVTDGTLRIHYYTPNFDGVVVGTEDVLITPFTCDRTGSGDAVVAAIMRKLTTHPEMYEDEDKLVRQLRFAVAAGIISQWTIGAVRGFPTESATKNLKEQVYVPSMW